MDAHLVDRAPPAGGATTSAAPRPLGLKRDRRRDRQPLAEQRVERLDAGPVLEHGEAPGVGRDRGESGIREEAG